MTKVVLAIDYLTNEVKGVFADVPTAKRWVYKQNSWTNGEKASIVYETWRITQNREF